MPTSKDILYIGPYRQNDGWGLAAYGYLLSLLETHHNIHCVPIYLSQSIRDINHPKILAAENSHKKSYDIIIQKALPMAICPNNYAKNIALIVLENNLLYSDGISNLQRMDQIWVPSNKEIRCLKNSGIKNETHAIMQAIPTEEIMAIKQQNAKITFSSPITQKSYKFYFIGEHIQRKNLKDIIIAFHTEFDIDEPVSLIIKTSVPGMNDSDALRKVKNDIIGIKKSLRTRQNFKEEVIITNRLSDQHLFSLHNSCDCCISVSYGEAFCRPIAEAVCFGNPVILTNGIGACEMINDEDKLIVKTQEQPVIMEDMSHVSGLDMYNANETWSIPSILDLKKQMRKAFQDQKKVDSQIYLDKFSYKNIGKILCQFIQ